MKKELIKTVLYRALITPDGTVLGTTHRHDYKSHVDRITKETYFIDGGLDIYYRTSINKIKATIIELYNTDNIIILRDYLTRGTFDKDNNRIYKLIKDCSNDHIKNIIEYNKQYDNELVRVYNDIYYRELKFREEQGIFIENE